MFSEDNQRMMPYGSKDIEKPRGPPFHDRPFEDLGDQKGTKVNVYNLPEMPDKEELEDRFSKYGKIISVNCNIGSADILFERELDAQNATRYENKTLFKNLRIDVSVAGDSRRLGPQGGGQALNRGRKLSPERGPYPPPRDAVDSYGRSLPPFPRERSPPRDPYDPRYRDYGPPRDDRFRGDMYGDDRRGRFDEPPTKRFAPGPQDHYKFSGFEGPEPPMDPYYKGGYAPDMPHPGRDMPHPGRDMPHPGRDMPHPGRDMPLSGRDAPLHGRDMPHPGRDAPLHGRDMPHPGRDAPPLLGRDAPPHGRDLPPLGRDAPIHGRDLPPHSRDLPPLPPPSSANDCEIIVLNKAQQAFAESIESRLKNLGMKVDLLFLKDETLLMRSIDDISIRGTLYAIEVSDENERHSSMSVNILHSTTPQAHRNMPLDEGLKLLAFNFHEYLKCRENVRPEPAPIASFLPPTRDTQLLLKVLSDGKFLTAPELDIIMKYLEERKEKLVGFENPNSKAPAKSSHSSGPMSELHSSSSNKAPEEEKPTDRQNQLQQRIFNLITQQNPPPSSASPPSNPPPNQPTANQPNSQSPSTYINFDSPNVRKALDNLIQSGPNLLKNINIGGNNQPEENRGKSGSGPSMGQFGGNNGGSHMDRNSSHPASNSNMKPNQPSIPERGGSRFGEPPANTQQDYRGPSHMNAGSRGANSYGNMRRY